MNFQHRFLSLFLYSLLPLYTYQNILILKNLIEQESGRVLLEIDPVTDNVSAARLHFYQLHGFVENPYPHTHPAYRNGYPDHSLVVLSSGETIPDIEYKRFASDLNRVIMKKGR